MSAGIFVRVRVASKLNDPIGPAPVLNMNASLPLQSPSPRPGAPDLPEFGLLEEGRVSQDLPENT